MKKIILSFGLLALLAMPALGQDKEEERVANAGKVIKEIMNIPDNVPQDVIDKADCVVVLPSVTQICLRDWRQLWSRRDDMPKRQEFSWRLERSHHDGAGGRQFRIATGWAGD